MADPQRSELPHFTQYLRRLRRLSARGTIALTLFWLIALLSSQWFPLLEPNIGISGVALLPLAIVFAGKFAAYWIVAETMASLGSEGRGQSPQWYLSLLSDQQALLGTLAAAMLAALPASVGMLAFMPNCAGESLTYGVGSWIPWVWGGELRSFYYVALMNLVKLPLFALSCAAILLALRQLGIASLLPALLAFGAVLCGLWDASMFAGPDGLQIHGLEPDSRVALLLLVVIGLALFALLVILLKLASEQRQPGAGQALLCALMLGLPATAAALSIMTLYGLVQNPFAIHNNYNAPPNAAYASTLIGAHLVGCTISPDAHPLWTNVVPVKDYSYYRYHRRGGAEYRTSSYGSSGVRSWMLYGVDVGRYGPWGLALFYLAAAAVWYWTALRCLRAARFPAWNFRRPDKK